MTPTETEKLLLCPLCGGEAAPDWDVDGSGIMPQPDPPSTPEQKVQPAAALASPPSNGWVKVTKEDFGNIVAMLGGAHSGYTPDSEADKEWEDLRNNLLTDLITRRVALSAPSAREPSPDCDGHHWIRIRGEKCTRCGEIRDATREFLSVDSKPSPDALREALENISLQKTAGELTDKEKQRANFEYAHTMIIEIARAALSAPSAPAARLTALEKALRNLCFAARTSGGTAGRDDFLCKACDEAEALLP